MTHELIRRETSYSRMLMSERMAYANMLAGAGDLIPRGLFDPATGRPSPAKIFLVLETGAMLGLEPMASLQGIDVIEGTATLSPRLVLALIRAAGYRVQETEHGTIEQDGRDYGWSVEVYDDELEQAAPIASTTFRLADAVRAGLCTLEQDSHGWRTVAMSERGKPLPWQQYPSDMVLWRAVGRVSRRGFSHVTLGIAYMPEELASGVVGEDGTRELPTAESENLIDALRRIDDRADLSAWWKLHREDDAMTPAVRNALDAHLLTITRDSRREHRPGSPGNTGIAELDQAAQPPADPGESPVTPDDPEPSREPDVEAEAAQHALAVGEQIGDDPEWTGVPCPACSLRHDASLHDAAEADAS